MPNPYPPTNLVRLYGFVTHTPKFSIRAYQIGADAREVSHLGFWLQFWARDMFSQDRRREGALWVKAYDSTAELSRKCIEKFTWLWCSGILRQTPVGRSIRQHPDKKGVLLVSPQDDPEREAKGWLNRGLYMEMKWFRIERQGHRQSSITILKTEYEELKLLAKLAKENLLHLEVPKARLEELKVEESFSAPPDDGYTSTEDLADLHRTARREMIRDGLVQKGASPPAGSPGAE